MLNDVSYSTTQQCQLVKPYEGFSLYNTKKREVSSFKLSKNVYDDWFVFSLWRFTALNIPFFLKIDMR